MKKCSRLLCTLLLFSFYSPTSIAQQVMMQGWYWDYPKTAAGFSWADTLRLKAASLKASGITHLWFPPHAIASSGSNSNGYDPADLFIGNQTSGLGTRTALNRMLAECTIQGVVPVADLIFNHRDGGKPEINPFVKNYITHFYTAEKEPYPSDRFRCILPLGGASGNGAGDYYFKISSKTQHNRFFNFFYKVYMETKKIGFRNVADLHEVEPNGGSDCGAVSNEIQLGRDMIANIDAIGCKTDEFKLTLTTSDFNATGDTLFISLSNTADPANPRQGYKYSDHRIYGIHSTARNTDIVADLAYQTYTSFKGVASGRGQMDFEFFKPNSINAATSFLKGDWDSMLFFYDYDQFQKQTKDSLIKYAEWNWSELGVRGLRMDAVKHFTPAFVGDLLDSMHSAGMDPGLVVGEWLSSNEHDLKKWVNDVLDNMEPSTKTSIQPKIFDFTLRENLRRACDDTNFDVRNVIKGSLRDATGLSGFNIITFTNNHDFRESDGFNSLIRNHPLLAYTYILSNNQLGVPTIFYPDYYGYPLPAGNLYSYHPTGLPPLNTEINVLIRALTSYIHGSPGVEYLNRFNTPFAANFLSGSTDKVLIYQLQGFAGNGNKDVVVAINFSNSRLKVDHEINNRGGLIATGTRFSDVLGKSAFPFALVSNLRQVYLELPPFSYSVWVQGNAPVLAVDLVNFMPVVKNRGVDIGWEITNKNKYSRCVLLRSKDGKVFKKIRTVELKPNSSQTKYSYRDSGLPRGESFFYQLKLITRNNTARVSEIKEIKLKS